MLRGIEADQARDLLLALDVQSAVESVELAEALGRVCASQIEADLPIPPFDRSPYDGYAFRGEDTRTATRQTPVVLSVLERIAAGQQPKQAIRPGTASRIMTGAPIPQGANATIKYEKTKWSASEVRLFEPVLPNSDIVRAGEDMAAGADIAPLGTLITPPVQGLLASQGIAAVDVFRKPVITVITGGSELAEAGLALPPAKIYNSNIQVLGGYLRELGAVFKNGGNMPDHPELMAESIHRNLSGSDMLLTTGGVSVGDYDFMIQALDILGATNLFWKTAMKPGGSILAATLNNRVILGLSGNPGAALLGLFRIAVPYIRKLCGQRETGFERIQVILKQPLLKKSPQMRLLRGRLVIEDAKAFFVENREQGNGSVSSFAGADLLAEIPAGSEPLEAGTMVRAWRIGR